MTANVYVVHVEDARGDLIDIEYFCRACANEHVVGSTNCLCGDPSRHAPSITYPFLSEVEPKPWPAPEALDYPVYCGSCGERLPVPLTADGEAYCRERGIEEE